MTEITFNNKPSRPAIKCGDWLLISNTLYAVAQVAVGEFQLIAILKNETNRKSDAGRVKSPNGYLAFSEKEIYALTGGDDYQKVNVSITVT